jgi:adenylosuccinate synthase
MKADVLLGLQWGDEGKGKIVDVLTPNYDIVARFQGGPNAGHTLEFNGQKHVLHTVPSGIFHERCINIIGNGVVIDPVILYNKEANNLIKAGVDIKNKLLVSKKAHLILPTHRFLDAASEAAKGKEKIGSTLKGIGPTYMDKTGRNGIRVGDITHPDFKKKYKYLVTKHAELLKFYDFEYDLAAAEKEWFESLEFLKELQHIDSEIFINHSLTTGKTVLAEGAQGTLLDIEFGSYPYVTSSNTICAGACVGLGIAPSKIGEVFGIFKAYCTRVGSGPFPTELNDEIGQYLRDKGNEYGSTTGRPRRCGWLDLPALKYAIMLNGVTRLLMMKADVLSGLDTIKICTHYKYNGTTIDYIPYNINDGELIPIYKEFKGWKEDLSKATSIDDLPLELALYIQYIESQLNVPITLVSVGPDRKQTLYRNKVVNA